MGGAWLARLRGGWVALVVGWTDRVGRQMGWYGPAGRNVKTARKGVHVCRVKNMIPNA